MLWMFEYLSGLLTSNVIVATKVLFFFFLLYKTNLPIMPTYTFFNLASVIDRL